MPGRSLEQILDALEPAGCEPKQGGGRYSAHCPAHLDGHSSLSISEGDDGRVLLHCHAGCATEDVVGALGLRMRDLFCGKGRCKPSRKHEVPKPGPAPNGCTLAEYAELKNLLLDILSSLGIQEVGYSGAPALRIPYYDASGLTTATRYRTALTKSQGADSRFRWRKGDKPTLYGLWRLDKAREAGYCLIVEGESDCHVAWFHGLPCIGVPGAATWRDAWASALHGIERLILVREPDEGGETLARKLSGSPLSDRLFIADLPVGFKDVSDLHVADAEGFIPVMQSALDAAVPARETEEIEQRERASQALAVCRQLAESPNILARFEQAVTRAGLAGEGRNAKVLFLALVSRLLERPTSVAVKGVSSAGKSFLIDTVRKFVPVDSYILLSGASERFLAYDTRPLKHKFIILYEWPAGDAPILSQMVRSVLSEGRIEYGTVEKTGSVLKPRVICRDGPTGLLVTTTRLQLDPELETRLLSLSPNDTPDQTREVMRALAERGPEPDYALWHALQDWLESGPTEVYLPFARALAEMVPTAAVRMRRDFSMVLSLSKAHALLHRATREIDDQGRIVASIADYAAVRALVEDKLAEGLAATIPPSVRHTVEAVVELSAAGHEPVKLQQLVKRLKLDKSTVWRRVKQALASEFIKDDNAGAKGKPLLLRPGEPMPSDEAVLPSAGAVEVQMHFLDDDEDPFAE